MRLFRQSLAILAVASTAAAAPPPPGETESLAEGGESPEPAPSTSAAQPEAAPAPYEPWQGAAHAAPTAAPVEPPPPIPLAAPTYFRRPVELVPALAMTLPNCRAGNQSNDRCEGVGVGGLVGFSVFWRVTPYFAWGGGFEVAGFTYNPPERVPLTNARAGAVWLGLKGRVYFNEEGSLDPYLELGLGLGALGTTGDDPAGDTYEETGAGPTASVGGGLDFFLSRGLRLGPRVAYTRVFVDKIRRCRASGDGECVDVPKDSDGHLNAYLTLGVGLTVMLGEEL
jgi:hypothetical protein